ncbi:vitamin K epoxide reductase family protein [Schaalia sp. 19OD2882]|uniref:vitamin K epoxide reductase family protein n=1 Tax=Schaalia sp. 19OD2882 TaxID=2794089 RepID=UPI001C1EC8AE|nr:vitamin K epoxide reductase family protein [Schaalia sp. 19OD2882]QWW18695.1 vitamin K epoxide reductase family protein [Schaalia sp. 19OD2882]
MSGEVEVDEIEDRAPLAWVRRTSIEMILSGVVGLVASFVLSIEAWQLAMDANTRFGCDVSAVLSCSSVAQSWQARILGFPNAFLGILFETAVLCVSVALMAGVRFPRWYMLCVEALYTVGLAFALWLFSQSYAVLHVLCPWCLLITVTTTLVWAGLTRINIREGHLPAPALLRSAVRSGADWALTGFFLFVLAALVGAAYGPAMFA